MSADTGPRKRFKDKKRKKGSSDGSIPGPTIIQKDAYPVKLISDENMHIHKETKFGGSIVSQLIFFLILLGIGVALFFLLANNEKKNETSWLADYFNVGSYFFADEASEVPVEVNDEDRVPDTELEKSFIENLWESFSFSREIKNTDAEEEINHPNYESSDFKEDPDTSDRDEDDQDLSDNEEDDDDDNDNTDENESNGGHTENDADYDDENDDDIEKEDEDHHKDVELPAYQKGAEENSDEVFDDENEHKRSDSNEDSSSSPAEETTQNKNSQFRIEDQNDDDDSDDEDSESGDDYVDLYGSEILEQSDLDEPEEKSSDVDTNVNTDGEQTTTNVVTKLGVGIALMFVAYSVIIRKWEDYEILVPTIIEDEEYELLDDIENDNATPSEYSQYTYGSDQLPDEKFDENLQNDTTDNYAETPSISDSEDNSDGVMRWSTSNSADILANDIPDSESITSESIDNSDVEAEAFQNQYTTEDYGKANITNTYDWQVKNELDQADQDFDNRHFTNSLNQYKQILQIYPHSARAKFGVATSLDAEAELLQSNTLLANAIEAYVNTLFTPEIPDSLFKVAGERAINRMRFKGEYESSITIQNLLINRFPDNISYQNDLVISLLMLNRMQEAKQRLQQILISWPDNGLALVHYGFVLKLEGDLPTAILYLSRGIETNETGTQDGRFYFHLGDALQRLGRNKEAMQIYKYGVENGIFLSEYQRSLYNVKKLTSRPWWTLQQTTYKSFFSKLKKNWEIIRDEGVLLLRQHNSTFSEESEQLREMGDWKQFELFSRGSKRAQCSKAPITCQLISEFEPAAGCRRGQVKFSVMEPGTHVWPHCGPTNCRLRAHLGLIVPSNVTIRVASETKQWKEGEIFVFDDSFEHEVWHNGSSPRLILIVDVWHPELTIQERRSLPTI